MPRTRSQLAVAVAAFLLLASHPAAGAGAPPFEVHADVDVMVAMRDGVKLATDIYRPTGDGQPDEQRRPVILIRTPYNKGTGDSKEGRYFAALGYVVVVQDTRGRFNSEGTWRWMTDDGPDGFDCAEWIVAQDWSNGRIGMMGTSYVGGTQHALAMSGSPHLKTAIPVDAVSNMGRQSMRNAGAFELRFWNWIISNAGQGSHAARDPGTAAALAEMALHRRDYLQRLPLRRGTTPLMLAPEYEDWLVEAMRHGANDAFWDQSNIVDHPERYPDIPVYLVGGWYDSWAGNTTANYAALHRQLKSDVYLIMGPWIHGAQGSFAHGQVTFGKDAAISDPLAWRRAWFDHYLNQPDPQQTAAFRQADPFRSKVRIFVMGSGDGSKDGDGRLNHGGFWRDEQEWPLERAVSTAFYFGADGALSMVAPPAPANTPEAATSFTFDPEDPVPTIGGNISSGNDILLQGAWDQRGGPHVWNWQQPVPLSARNDVVVFQTDPLPDDAEVTGEIEVRLWISSTAVDTDFTAKLIDVYPPSADFPGGFELNIGDGIARARFRDSLQSEQLMTPGENVLEPITLDCNCAEVKLELLRGEADLWPPRLT